MVFLGGCARAFVLTALVGGAMMVCAADPATNSAGSALEHSLSNALARPRPSERLKALSDVASALAVPEIQPALRAASAFRQLREQAVFRDAVLKRWTTLKPREAFAHISALPESRTKLEAIRFAAAKLAGDNPREAANAVEKLGAARSKNEAIDVVASVWARASVREALKWAEELPNGFARESALNSVRFVWVHTDPVSAAPHVQQLPAGDTRNALLTNIAGEWATRDPHGAIRWAERLGDSAEKSLFLSNIAESWADLDPRAAATFARGLAPDIRGNAMAAVISRWATQDPKTAMNWALKNGDSTVRARALSEVLNLWASVDAASAAKWVEQLRADDREIAIRSYVDAVIAWDPPSAARLATTLKEEAVKMDQLEKCLRRWTEIDPAGARAWIRTAELPLELKRQWANERALTDEPAVR